MNLNHTLKQNRDITTKSFALASHLLATGIEPLSLRSVDGSATNVVYIFPVSARAAIRHFRDTQDRLNEMIDQSLGVDHAAV